MYILKNQDIVLTSTWVVDQTITMNFSNCIQAITDRFSQLLVLSKQPFNQALVLINQQFKFVSMNSSQKFQAKITQDLTLVFTTLGHIINQKLAESHIWGVLVRVFCVKCLLLIEDFSHEYICIRCPRFNVKFSLFLCNVYQTYTGTLPTQIPDPNPRRVNVPNQLPYLPIVPQFLDLAIYV